MSRHIVPMPPPGLSGDGEGTAAASSKGGAADAHTPPWKPGKALLHRRKVLRKNIKEVRPHEITQEMADGALWSHTKGAAPPAHCVFGRGGGGCGLWGREIMC